MPPGTASSLAAVAMGPACTVLHGTLWTEAPLQHGFFAAHRNAGGGQPPGVSGACSVPAHPSSLATMSSAFFLVAFGDALGHGPPPFVVRIPVPAFSAPAMRPGGHGGPPALSSLATLGVAHATPSATSQILSHSGFSDAVDSPCLLGLLSSLLTRAFRIGLRLGATILGPLLAVSGVHALFAVWASMAASTYLCGAQQSIWLFDA